MSFLKKNMKLNLTAMMVHQQRMSVTVTFKRKSSDIFARSSIGGGTTPGVRVISAKIKYIGSMTLV